MCLKNMDSKITTHMKYLPISEAIKPKSGIFKIHVNDYWSVVEKDGVDCVMLYRGYAPQCNSNIAIVEHIKEKLYPEAKIVQLPIAYMPCGEYN